MGIFVFLFGIAMLMLSFTKLCSSRKAAIIVGIIFIVVGFLIMFGQYTKNDDLILFAICISVGSAFTFIGCVEIFDIIRCKEKIEATYLKYNEYSYRGNSSYSPFFEFYYGGKKYTGEPTSKYSKRYITKHFEKRKNYMIYINPKHPQNIIINKRLGCLTFLILPTGLLTLFTPFYYLYF